MKKSRILLKLTIGISLIFLTIVLIGCKKSNAIQTQVAIKPGLQSTGLNTTQVKISATFTPQLSKSPIISTTPTVSSFPLKTITPIFIPTMTALPLLPTLSQSEAETLIMELLTNNTGCKLPCWWGFTPGQSIWNRAKQYLETFTEVDGPVIYEEDHQQKVGYEIRFQVDGKELVFGLNVDDNYKISDFSVPPDTSIYKYRLDQLLISSGKPKEIWLAPMPYTPGGAWYYLVLYYPTQGIVVRYGGSATPNIKINSQGKATIASLKICPIGPGPELWLVPPNTLDGIKGDSTLGGTAFTDLLTPIQIATNMNVDEFYSIFEMGDNSTCFETPSESWP